MRKVQVAPILVLLLLEVYTATSKSLLSKRGAVEDVQDDNGLKDLAKQLVKNRGSGYIDCDNILVWDALLQEEENQERTIKTCDLCSDDEFLKMHMELFEKHCGYGKGGFPPICFNPAGWENLLYSFKEEQLVKACALCDNGMFRRVHPEIFGEHCELDEQEEEEEGKDEKDEDARGTAEEEDEEDEKEDTRGTAEEEDGEDEKEETRGTAEEEDEDDEKEETRGTAEEEDEDDEKEETRGTAEEEDEDDEKEETRGTAEEEDGEDEKEETRGTAEEEDEDDEKEETRGTAQEEDEEDEKEETRGTAEEEEDEEDEKEESREVAEKERGEEEEEEDKRAPAEDEDGEDKEESREVEPDHDEETRGNKLDFIDKGKTDDDLVLAVQQFVRDTAKNMEDLADRLVRYDRKQKVKEWEP